ncbi:unnamed protein product [Durusdinium trenchii]|uniref:Uncharacterized protein n=1 Tax=Durusdinium trenchii TaxID=1381693 RepID=A0ABP0L5D6_9DINO
MGDRGSEASGGFGQGDDELFQFLEQKRKEVAAMTQAAEIAREQALQLLRLQQEVARIDRITESGLEGTTYSEQVAERTSRPQRGTSSGVDALMGSTALGSVGELPTTTLSLEDRRRFGLDGTPPPSEATVPERRDDFVGRVSGAKFCVVSNGWNWVEEGRTGQTLHDPAQNDSASQGRMGPSTERVPFREVYGYPKAGWKRASGALVSAVWASEPGTWWPL